MCESPPALFDCYHPVAGELGRGIAILLGGTAHGHQTVELSSKIQDLHNTHIKHAERPKHGSSDQRQRQVPCALHVLFYFLNSFIHFLILN